MRCERPVEGCEVLASANASVTAKIKLEPHVRAKLLERNPHYFEFKWYRGPLARMCASESCARCATRDPSAWCKQAGAFPMQCAECQRAGLPRAKTVFCSTECFKSSWLIHSKLHVSTSDTDGAAKKAAGDDEEEWVELCEGKQYVANSEDRGRPLRIQCKVLSEMTGEVLAGPLTLQTEPVLGMPEKSPRRDIMAISSVPGNHGAPFRVVSYNALAEIYATKQMYPHLDTWALAWSYRRMLLFQELIEMHADIICLQEVQADHYERDVFPFMQSMNYEGVYCQKSRESMGAYGKIDGCAIFWNCSKFMLVDSCRVEFNELVRSEAIRMNFNEAQTRKYINALCKDNIAQFVTLDFINSQGSPICIGNTHLYSNYLRPEVRLWQTYFFMKELSQVLSQRDCAVVICGDFNSEPDSAVYEFLKRGRVSANRPELMSAEVQVLPKLDEIRHSLDIQSAMAHAMGQEPLFTNYTANYKGVLDYIWFSHQFIDLTHVLMPPSEEAVVRRSGVGLPSTQDPSDHIPLCVDFSLLS